MFKLKRAYEPPAPDDGFRVLVERLWPRGVTKARARLDGWMKDLAPSPELRRWFGHDPDKWDEFRQRYARELRKHAEDLGWLRSKGRAGPVTLVYGSKDERHNAAVALKQVLERPHDRT